MKIRLIIGLPLSGKGSLCKIARRLNPGKISVFSTGEYFMDHIKRQTSLGTLIEDDVRSGGRVTDETVHAVCVQEISKIIQRSDHGHEIWIDGAPRSVGQADNLLFDFLDRFDLIPDGISVISITTSSEECVRRAHHEAQSDPGRVSRHDANPKIQEDRVIQDMKTIPDILKYLRHHVPKESFFEFDGTHMRRDATGFLQQLGFDVPNMDESRVAKLLS